MLPSLLLAISAANGATLSVPADYATVQQAIDASAPNDVIEISAGVYPDDVYIDSGNITIRGAGMGTTTIGPGAGSWAVSIWVTGLVLEDLTITGGGLRGGVRVDTNTDVTLTRVEVRDALGGGLWARGTSLTIDASRFIHNTLVGFGAGIFHEIGQLTIDNSVFCGNVALRSTYGEGGGLYSNGGDLVVQRSLFVANMAEDYGGAMQIEPTTPARLANNTLAFNAAPSGSGLGIYNAAVDVTNTIIASGDASGVPIAGGNNSALAIYMATGSATGGHNLYFSNSHQDTDQVLFNDIFGADPMFATNNVDCESLVVSDYALVAGSPAIGAGDAVAGLFDDIGAVEYTLVDNDGDGFDASVDCDDDDNARYPGAVEVVGDGIDQDCDGDERCFADEDGDGFGDGERTDWVSTAALDCVAPGASPTGDDCDDTRANSYPGAVEICDGLDNDCDQINDNIAQSTLFPDLDDDGFGDAFSEPVASCDVPAVANALDCDDTDATTFPGAEEVCDDIDHDCSGDPYDAQQVPTWYVDADADGYGNPDTAPVESCEAPPNHIDNADDCDDTDATVSPGEIEVACDGVDNDCSADTPDGTEACFDATTVADPRDDNNGLSSAVACGCGTGSGFAPWMSAAMWPWLLRRRRRARRSLQAR